MAEKHLDVIVIFCQAFAEFSDGAGICVSLGGVVASPIPINEYGFFLFHCWTPFPDCRRLFLICRQYLSEMTKILGEYLADCLCSCSISQTAFVYDNTLGCQSIKEACYFVCDNGNNIGLQSGKNVLDRIFHQHYIQIGIVCCEDIEYSLINISTP